MSRIFIFLAFLVAAFSNAKAVQADNIQRFRSPTGVEAWLKHEPTIPMIAVEMAWRDAGSAEEPAEHQGLARALAAQLDEGAGDLDDQKFQEKLEELAGSISFGAERDIFRGSLRTLTRHRDEMFRLLGLALTEPRFDPEPLARFKQQTRIELSRQKENPSAVTSRILWQTAFPNHPYGRDFAGTEESIETVTADNLRNYLTQHLAKSNLIIGIVGDITTEEAGRLIDIAFSKLPNQSAPSIVAKVEPKLLRNPIIVSRDIPQSQVQFLGRGVKRADPDFFPALIMNYILGGTGLNSRLTTEVRDKKGLAYSISSSILPTEQTGLYIGSFGTQNERAGETLAIVRHELKRMRDHGVTSEELKNAKTFLNGSFPLSLSSNSRIAGLLVQIQFDRLGEDYLAHRATLINAVTLEDIRRVAARLLDPDNLLVVIAGKPVGIGG